MSKKKRSKKRERIPVIDTLIDLAGAMTLDYFAAKRRQKNGTKRSKKIDPYAATDAARWLSATHAIPPWMIGYFIPRSLVISVCIICFLSCIHTSKRVCNLSKAISLFFMCFHVFHYVADCFECWKVFFRNFDLIFIF